MGLLTDLFVGTTDEAQRYELAVMSGDKSALAKLEPVSYRGLTPLEFGTLWAILLSEKWDVERHMLDEVAIGDGGETWLFRFPAEYAALLSSLDEKTISAAAIAWTKSDELAHWSPEDLLPIIRSLVALASKASSPGISLYLWGSL